jgi:hypothetical protein
VRARSRARRARNEVAQHLLCHLEVRDHAVAERPCSPDVRGRAPDHPPRLITHSEHTAGQLIDRDDRRLEQDHSGAPPDDDGVRRAKVDGQPPRTSHTQEPHRPISAPVDRTALG